MASWDDEDKVQSEKDKRDERLGEALHHEYTEEAKGPQQAPERPSSPELDFPGGGTLADQPQGDPNSWRMHSPAEGYQNVRPAPTPAPVEPKLSDAVMPAALANAQALQTPQKAPSAVARASGGVGPGSPPGQAPTGLVGPSPDPTLGLSSAPQTPPAPAAPRGPSAVEQLLASRAKDREELRKAQYDAETNRMAAQGLNAVRAGLAMEAGHSPDAEAERSSMEAADAPIRDVLARQRSDQDFQQQVAQAQEIDKKRDADDPSSPMSVRATLMARAHGYRGEPITANEYGDWLKGADLDEKVAQRKTQAAAEASKGQRETAQSAEDVRWHNMEYNAKMAALKAEQAKGAKIPPMAEAEIQQFKSKVAGLEANESMRRELQAAGMNPVARSAVINRYLPAVTAGIAPPNSSRGIAFMNDVRNNQLPGALRDGSTKNQWHDAHGADESKAIEDTLDVQGGDPRVEAIRRIYANTQQKVLASRGHTTVEMHFPDGSAQMVPTHDVAKAIMMHGRTEL